jgi:arginine deiminase
MPSAQPDPAAPRAEPVPPRVIVEPVAPSARQRSRQFPGADAGVTSEIGPLRRVLLHRPGAELARLTPANKDRLLFDEVPWLEGAQREHDRFSELLREQGTEVLYLQDLLADVLELEHVRARLVGAGLDEPLLGRRLTQVAREWLLAMAAPELARTLVTGVTFGELPVGPPSLVSSLADPAAFVLGPLPNLMFTRDTSAWIGTRALLGRMATEARAREVLYLDAIYTSHPRFAQRPAPWRDPAPLEGGDVLVLAPHRVLIGVGARTHLGAVERVARSLLAGNPAAEIAVAVMRSRRATIHLDTIVTMLDHDAFTIYPPAAEALSMFRLRSVGGELRPEPEPDLVHTLRRLTGRDELRIVETGGDSLRRDREQWDDANNVLALRPGTVVGYDRNGATNERIAAAGIEVLTFPGSELGRGRGGARCLSCPLSRRPLATVD